MTYTQSDVERALRGVAHHRRYNQIRHPMIWARLIADIDPWDEFSPFTPDASSDRARICEAVDRADEAIAAAER